MEGTAWVETKGKRKGKEARMGMYEEEMVTDWEIKRNYTCNSGSSLLSISIKLIENWCIVDTCFDS